MRRLLRPTGLTVVLLLGPLSWPGCKRMNGGDPAPAATDAALIDLEVPLPPINCRPEVGASLPTRSNDPVRCVVDVGSRNVKLVVAAARAGEPTSFTNLRQCRARLQLGDKAVDPATGHGQPLPLSEQQALVGLIKAFVRRCASDGGKLERAVATEWGRRATNIGEVAGRVVLKTQVSLAVLTREEEARYGYLSATRGTPGKLVLDFGSRSMQVAFWARDAQEPEVLSVPLGIDETGDRYFGAQDASYNIGRSALLEAYRRALQPLFEKARSALRKQQLEPELYSLGENGDMSLAVAGDLWPGVPAAAVDEAGYGAAVKAASIPIEHGRYGKVAAVLTPEQLQRVGETIARNKSVFDALRSPRLRRVYGNKMLVYPVLIDLFEREFGVRTVVMVPQEMADGYLIARLK